MQPRAAVAAARPNPGWTGVAVVVVAVLVFLIDASPRAAAPFGNSQDGMNGAVWASGAEAIATEGLVDSRLGAYAPGREVYAHHPPGIYVVTALARAIGGDDELALRMPELLASLTAIVLAWPLLRRLGASIVGAVCGVAALVASEMFLLYGAMLNFEALALPVVLATLLVVVERADHATRSRSAFALGLAGALLSWEGILLCGAIAAWGEWSRHRDERPAVTTRWLAAGASLGTALTVTWLTWANRGFAGMWTALRQRTDATTAGLGDQVTMQVDYARFNFSPWWMAVALVGLWALIRVPSTRRVSHGLLLAVPLAFMVGFPGGAYFHPYWNHWLVATIAVLVALGADTLIAGSRARGGAFASAAMVLLVLAPHVDPSPVRQQFTEGAAAAELLVDYPSATGDAWTWPALSTPNWWVGYYTRQPLREISTTELDAVARTDPAHPVLVWEVAVEVLEGPGIYDALRPAAIEARGEYLVVPADRLAAIVSAR